MEHSGSKNWDSPWSPLSAKILREFLLILGMEWKQLTNTGSALRKFLIIGQPRCQGQWQEVDHKNREYCLSMLYRVRGVLLGGLNVTGSETVQRESYSVDIVSPNTRSCFVFYFVCVCTKNVPRLPIYIANDGKSHLTTGQPPFFSIGLYITCRHFWPLGRGYN